MTEGDNIYQAMIKSVRDKDASTYLLKIKEYIAHIQHFPHSIIDLARTVLETLLQGGVFFDLALSFLPMEHWPSVVEQAVTTLEHQPDHQTALDIIACASFQCPRAVHPYLEQLLPIIGDEYDGMFKELPLEKADFLFAAANKILSGEQWIVDEKRVFLALLETRLPEALEFVRSHGKQYVFYLSEVGFEELPTGFRQLYPSRVWHLAFPPEYLSQIWSFLPDKEAMCHPTWIQADAHAHRHRFGGMSETICGLCGEPVHHFITLDPIPPDLGVRELSRIEVVVCLSCLDRGQKLLSYQHDARGKPQSIDHTSEIQISQTPAFPLKETEVNLVELGVRWRWQDLGVSNKRENVHRVGGYPSWIQSARYPTCPLCGQMSSFLLQLFSFLPVLDGDEWLLGDDGMGYVFWCDRCKVTSISCQYI